MRVIERGVLRAEWDPRSRRGWVRQTANPAAIRSSGAAHFLHR